MNDKPVLVAVTPEPASLDAIWWAANYATRGGSPLLIMHISPDFSSIVDRVRTRFPGLDVTQRYAAGAVVDILVAESRNAHVVVLADSCTEMLEGESVLTALSTLARCPVVSVPPDIAWSDPVPPVIVGVRDRERSLEKVEFAFAEAARLGTGVRLVRCTPRRRGGAAVHEGALLRLIGRVTARYPDVPVRTEVVDGSPARALAWHAHFGSMVIVGSRRGGPVHGALFRSVSRAVLRHGSSPVVVIGPHALSTPRISPDVAFLDTTRS